MPTFALVAIVAAYLPLAAAASPIANPAIDIDRFVALTAQAAEHRASRRLAEDDFLRLSREPGTIVLDARSREKFDELHITGAVSLSFPDIAVDSLARTIPDRSTRILIYCNNNFANAEGPFPSKLPAASLNLSSTSRSTRTAIATCTNSGR